MEKRAIYGPPGTGKTTKLLALLEETMVDINPIQIAYVSFTKQGTYEGVQRATERFDLLQSSTKYFRTIHSLCFKAMNMQRMDMVNYSHYRLFSKRTGISFTGFYTDDFSSSEDVYLHVVSMEKHNAALAFEMSKFLDERKLNYIRFQFGEMKKQLGIVDFDDLLVNYLKHGTPLPVKVAFIDEAQDLTPLQWKVVKKLFAKCNLIYAAGDDDQAVFEWAGANVLEFLKFSKKSVVLNKSYRLPFQALNVAKKISEDIRVRKKKLFSPSDKFGEVAMCEHLHEVNFVGGELILARTNRILRDMADELRTLGYPYILKGKSSVEKHVLNAIETYEKFQQGQATEKEMDKYRGFFGVVTKVDPWHVTLLDSYDVSYYTQLKKHLDMEPILLETFHSSKGSENEHVIVNTNITEKINSSFQTGMDAELRCLYVAVTRTKNKLTLLAPSSKFFYAQHYFQ